MACLPALHKNKKGEWVHFSAKTAPISLVSLPFLCHFKQNQPQASKPATPPPPPTPTPNPTPSPTPHLPPAGCLQLLDGPDHPDLLTILADPDGDGGAPEPWGVGVEGWGWGVMLVVSCVGASKHSKDLFTRLATPISIPQLPTPTPAPTPTHPHTHAPAPGHRPVVRPLQPVVEALLLHIGGHPVGERVVGQQLVLDGLNLGVLGGWGVGWVGYG